MVDLLRHFPYSEIREIQEKALEVLQREWNNYNIFVISAPTAFGKSAVSKAIMNTHYSSSTITPTNLLVEQYRQEFPDTCTLTRLDGYTCEEWKRDCATTRGKLKQFCRGCPASKDLARAKYKKGPGVYNYHVYLAHKLYRDVLIVDEAHNLIPHIRERMALRIWQHDYGYPSNMWTTEQQIQFIESLPENKRNHKKVRIWYESLVSRKPEYIPHRTTDEFNGKGTVRGEPEERDCIKLLPVDISQAPPMFWPREVRKIVLMSATIGRKDVETLGLLGRGRVLYIDCESPIPASRRPIIIDSVANVNRYNMETSTAEIARYIDEVLAPRYEGKKGVIHATYQQAQLLAKHLTGSRYLFHDKFNKKEQYEYFRRSPAESGRILVACGMYEGIDLPEDLGRWQVIAKIPWMSLGSPAVKYMSDQDPEWYYWETLRIVIQACGRVCRTPTDLGDTYILDGSFDRLYDNTHQLRPQWFNDALLSAEEWENSHE